MVVSGRRMNIFVNDAPLPTLAVARLEGDTMKGGLRLQGPATFANMVITPDAVGGLSPEPARDPLDGDRGLVRNWRLSSFSVLLNGKDPRIEALTAPSGGCGRAGFLGHAVDIATNARTCTSAPENKTRLVHPIRAVIPFGSI
jgi:hypothetical protein